MTNPLLPEAHPGAIVAKVHSQRTSTGEIGNGGKRDPKLTTWYIDLAPGFACEFYVQTLMGLRERFAAESLEQSL